MSDTNDSTDESQRTPTRRTVLAGLGTTTVFGTGLAGESRSETSTAEGKETTSESEVGPRYLAADGASVRGGDGIRIRISDAVAVKQLGVTTEHVARDQLSTSDFVEHSASADGWFLVFELGGVLSGAAAEANDTPDADSRLPPRDDWRVGSRAGGPVIGQSPLTGQCTGATTYYRIPALNTIVPDYSSPDILDTAADGFEFMGSLAFKTGTFGIELAVSFHGLSDGPYADVTWELKRETLVAGKTVAEEMFADV